jgi:hypothetical protein
MSSDCGWVVVAIEGNSLYFSIRAFPVKVRGGFASDNAIKIKR